MIRTLNLIMGGSLVHWNERFGVREFGMKPCLCSLPALWPWASHLDSKTRVSPFQCCSQDCRRWRVQSPLRLAYSSHTGNFTQIYSWTSWREKDINLNSFFSSCLPAASSDAEPRQFPWSSACGLSFYLLAFHPPKVLLIAQEVGG